MRKRTNQNILGEENQNKYEETVNIKEECLNTNQLAY